MLMQPSASVWKLERSCRISKSDKSKTPLLRTLTTYEVRSCTLQPRSAEIPNAQKEGIMIQMENLQPIGALFSFSTSLCSSDRPLLKCTIQQEGKRR